MMALPSGVGVLRVQLADGPMVVVSESLTLEEQQAGRLIAAAVCRRPDYPSVVLVMTEEIIRAVQELRAAIPLERRRLAS